MTVQETSTLHVMSMRVENFMRIQSMSIEANGRHIVVSGRNGAGKTSCLDALWSALGGKPGKDLPEPVNKAANRAKVILDLQDSSGEIAFHVERTWTEKGTRLDVRAADGSKIAKPQELLDSFVDAISLNPIEWLRKRPQDQVDDVLRVCGVAPPVSDVTAITGEHHTARPDESAARYLERLSADETGLYYIRRREAHRVLVSKDAALQEFGGAMLDGGADEPDQDISGLLAERGRLEQKREARREVVAQLESLRQSQKNAHAQLAGLRADLPKVESRIADLRRLLAEEEAKAGEIAGRIKRGYVVCSEWDAEVLAAQEAAALLPDPTPQIVDLDRQIADADRDRQAIARRRQARETVNRLHDEAEAARAAHGRLELVVAALRELRQNLLNDVDLGIRGLAVGDGELRLDEVSFKQASQAQKISVACAIAFKRDPRLKILRLDDAEHLDAESQALLQRLADENGWQCIMSFVRDEEMRIEFYDMAA